MFIYFSENKIKLIGFDCLAIAPELKPAIFQWDTND